MIKRRIIISSYDDVENPYYAGGGAVAVHEVARRLSSEYDVTVITGAYPGSRNVVRDGVQYRRIGWRWGGRLGQLVYSVLLPVITLRESFDVWIESFTPPFTASLLPLVTRKPVIGLVHFLPGREMWRRYKVPTHLTEPLVLKCYQTIIALTPVARAAILANNPRAEVFVIGNGTMLQPAHAHERIPGTVGYIGRIDVWQKGLDMLVRGFDTAAHTNAGLHLRIAGQGPRREERKLDALIAASVNARSIERLGRITAEEKDAFYRSLDWLLIPSRMETLPLVALEAMSYGVPVIGFDISGLEWIPSECGIRVPVMSADALSGVLASSVPDEALRNAKAEACTQFVETRSWDAVAQEYADVVHKTLATV